MVSIKFRKIISFVSLSVIYLCEIVIPPIYHFIINDEYPNPYIGGRKFISLVRALSVCMYALILPSIIIYEFLINNCNKGEKYKKITKLAFWDSFRLALYFIFTELVCNKNYLGVDIVISYWIHTVLFWIIHQYTLHPECNE